MQVINQRGVRYEDLTVADVMSPLGQLDAIVGRRHMLVVQKGENGQGPRVRGVFSQTQIERQLGKPIDVIETAGNFAEIRVSLAA